MTQTRSQRLAQLVYTQVAPIQHREEKFRKEYGRLCNRFPVLVLENGLAQTVGFLTGKAGRDPEKAEKIFLDHLKNVLFDHATDNMLSTVLNAELAMYQHYTRQALAAAVWYKRYAEGLLGIDSTGDYAQQEDSGNA